MNKTCKNCKTEFLIEPDDIAFYEQMQVPAPTFCPDCRLQRRLAVRNERSLYKIKCALCGKDSFSISPQGEPLAPTGASGYTVYCLECWSSDAWDPMQYGIDYDFSKPFFTQYHELLSKVPVRARFALPGTLTGSDYANLVSYLKNCYLIFNSDYDEYCMYGSEIEQSKECIDCTMIDTCETCYGCVNCQKCYRAFFSMDCESSSDIWFSKNLSGCNNCFGCMNLRKKSYHIFNEPYTREEYIAEISKIKSQMTIEKAQEFWLKYPVKYIHGRQNTNVSGDYINNSKEVRKSFIATEAQNCKYCLWILVKSAKDCWDYTEYGNATEQAYECVTVGDSANKIKFSHLVLRNTSDVEYSASCFGLKNGFGCVGLKNKQYCILNKQYSRDEYLAETSKIKSQMSKVPYVDKKGRTYAYGEFFPIELSQFAYNEAIVQEFFPLTKEQAIDQGYHWKDFEEKAYVPTKKWNEPYGLKDIVLCQAWDKDAKKAQEHNCTKCFRLTQQELEFYQRFNLPLPQACPNTRHFERAKFRNPFKLWKRQCAKCNAEIETSYSPDRPEIIYCESCYQQEVI